MPRQRLLVLLLVTALTALLPGTWTAAVAADPGSAPVSALPFVGRTGGAGTAAGNEAVSARCNAGAPLREPQWFALPASDGRTVYARATSYQYARATYASPVGLAFVDRATGAVIRCANGVGDAQLPPLAAPSTQQVDVVAFYPKPYEDLNGDGLPDTLRLLV